jgi:hypothetical protein
MRLGHIDGLVSYESFWVDQEGQIFFQELGEQGEGSLDWHNLHAWPAHEILYTPHPTGSSMPVVYGAVIEITMWSGDILRGKFCRGITNVSSRWRCRCRNFINMILEIQFNTSNMDSDNHSKSTLLGGMGTRIARSTSNVQDVKSGLAKIMLSVPYRLIYLLHGQVR